MSRLRALYVTDRQDAPYRYRCLHARAQLERSGALVQIRKIDEPSPPISVEDQSIVVLFRLRWGAEVEVVVESARRAGIPLVFDCDDLIFDPAAASLFPFRSAYSASDWEREYGAQLESVARTFQASDAFIGSTPGLAEWARRLGKPAFVHPNVVPDEYLALAPWLRRLRPGLRVPGTIGYFSGSNTHDADLASVAPALERVLATHPRARLVIGGFVELPESLRPHSSRVTRLPFMSHRLLPWALSACDVTIAPLSELNPFTHGKSALKFFEPGVFGVPVIASPSEPMKRAIDHGTSGWLASDADGFAEALEAALDAATNRRVGEAARRAVERHHTSRAVDGQLAKLLGELVDRPRAAARETKPSERRPPVDIVVPVHNAREQTLRCVRSVMRHARGDFRLVIVDDASTDPELWPALVRFAGEHPRVRLLRNERNLGFIHSVNRAFAESEDRDVLLLNSDTQVFRGFLRGLQRATYTDTTTGIVCPTSNNATICSVPEFGRNNPIPAGLRPKQMAELIKKSSLRLRPELVTPVGFCMYVRAEVLARLGPFDAERFGRGFGEENDFGERAKQAGFRIRLADDVYVWHEGKASFGEEGARLEVENARRLEERHPGYHARVAHFVEKNPLAPVHENLRLHLRRRRHRDAPAVMMLLHASPFAEPCGGTEFVVRELVERLRVPRALVAYPGQASIEVVEIEDGEWASAMHYRFPLAERVPLVCHEHEPATRVFRELLELFGVGYVHIHHLLGWPLSIERVLRRAKVPYAITTHDFYAICPSKNLLNLESCTSCCPAARGDAERTRACMRGLFEALSEPPPAEPVEFVDRHRRAFGKLMARASHVFYPSVSARRLIEAVHPESSRSRVLPHAYRPTSRVERPSHSERSSRLRVAIVGEVSYPSKGAAGYIEVIRRLRDAPIEWHVFGSTERFEFERRLASLGNGVSMIRHGTYARHEIVDLLQTHRIDVGLMLPICPETFSLTLSELLAAPVFVIAARQGALSDRLEGSAFARLVDTPEQAADALRALSGDRTQRLVAAGALEEPDVEAWLAAHREAYSLSDCEPARLKRRDYQRLGKARVSLTSEAESIRSIEPALRHRGQRWYRTAERLKPYLPESVRVLARRALSDERWRPIQRFRIPGSRVTSSDGLELEARYLNTARYSSSGSDPYFLVALEPVNPDEVGAIRFNVWCSHPGHTYAQLYWRHAGDSDFSEDKSVVVALKGDLGDWQDYLIRLERARHPSFYAGEKLVALRFDPVNYAGLFCVGELALCAP